MRLLTRAAALLGGLIWSVTVILTALRPMGVPGAHRSTLDLHPAILVSFLLMGVAAAALVRSVPKSPWMRSGIALIGLGAMLFRASCSVEKLGYRSPPGCKPRKGAMSVGSIQRQIPSTEAADENHG